MPVSKSSRWIDYLPMAVAGLMLIVAFAFAGHLIGRDASAHNSDAEDIATLVSPSSPLSTKGSLLPEGESVASINMSTLRRQTVISDGKGDLVDAAADIVPSVSPPLPKSKPSNMKTLVAQAHAMMKIIPAAIDLQHENDDAQPAVKRLVSNPALPNPNKQFAVSGPDKQKVMAQRNIRMAEENCLARAVYFESRSESDMGQLAVAKVILNRVKNPDFPKTICGVVYQGSGSRNSCQFSFACDGLADDVKSPASWAHAKSIAQRAINNDPAIAMLGNATNYHADYVTPRWAHTMRKLIKIGHHIFYANEG
ncbi:cell wall hydrolase [Aestuariivirga litoralis]|uniref:cell wall hydrolase n=1 Tax=Aestuariivirga litoralis TaxID=2650924 RepID=UPI0018C7838C|nr:cell wall hydrolase [Aestuariivirga litoralis]